MSAPVALTLSGSIALTVAAVPTGMKAGVRISPRCMAITPVRAAPSVVAIEKEKRVTRRAMPSAQRQVEVSGSAVERGNRFISEAVFAADRPGHIAPVPFGPLKYAYPTEVVVTIQTLNDRARISVRKRRSAPSPFYGAAVGPLMDNLRASTPA